MVISTAPIVLGNMKSAAEQPKYEKVAFMGQVPVKVMGNVKLGDYILPSGGSNGLGVAVSPSAMTASDYKKVVGVAWSSSTNPTVSTINVAVGLNANSLSTIVEQQARKIQEQEQELAAVKASVNSTNSLLAKLVPGFAEAAGLPAPTMGAIQSAPANIQSKEIAARVPNVSTTPSPFVTKSVIEDGIKLAQEIWVNNGNSIDKVPFFQQYNSNPGFREVTIRTWEEKINMKVLQNLQSK